MLEIPLRGCRPEPLAHYLKGLAVLRLVAEQADPEARGWWENDVFWLRSSLDRFGLTTFFLETYRPTPVIAPWNGGSGFFPGDKLDGIKPLEETPADRFRDYRRAIEDARRVLAALGLAGKKLEKKDKPDVLLSARNSLPEKALAWMDAAVVLTGDGAKYPPLLGTGGNDGRLDFTNNFMQRLVDLFDPGTGRPRPPSKVWLEASLFADPVPGLQAKKPIGQFFPGAAGGANASTGFGAEPVINPWDFVLTIEGALVFASAAARRMAGGQPGVLSYPFTVRAAGVGYGSAHGSDEKPRGETWLPLWRNQATLAEIAALFSEGRARVGRRSAVGGVDFARAVVSLGVDRGITRFQRYGFQERNGLAYFATPLGRWRVAQRPETDLLAEIDTWLERFRSQAGGGQAPARLGRALRGIERAIMEFCREGGPRRFSEIIIALGEAESALAGSPKFRKDANLKPVPLLSGGWLRVGDDGSPEFRLAAALASTGLRENMEPVKMGRWVTWLETDDHPRVVWGSGDLVGNLGEVLRRRYLDAHRPGGPPALRGESPATLGDVAAFIRGETDDARLEALLKGLILVDWSGPGYHPAGPGEPLPPALFSLLKLTHLPHPLREVAIPWEGSILARALSGDAAQAGRLAARRLRGSGFRPSFEAVCEPVVLARRAGAALLIPISEKDSNRLATIVLRANLENKQGGIL